MMKVKKDESKLCSCGAAMGEGKVAAAALGQLWSRRALAGATQQVHVKSFFLRRIVALLMGEAKRGPPTARPRWRQLMVETIWWEWALRSIEKRRVQKMPWRGLIDWLVGWLAAKNCKAKFDLVRLFVGWEITESLCDFVLPLFIGAGFCALAIE